MDHSSSHVNVISNVTHSVTSQQNNAISAITSNSNTSVAPIVQTHQNASTQYITNPNITLSQGGGSLRQRKNNIAFVNVADSDSEDYRSPAKQNLYQAQVTYFLWSFSITHIL